MSEKNIDKLNLAKYPDDSKKGLVLETDLEYPKELHDSLNDYPLAAENWVCLMILSKYCQKIKDKSGMSIGQVKKLIPT